MPHASRPSDRVAPHGLSRAILICFRLLKHRRVLVGGSCWLRPATPPDTAIPIVWYSILVLPQRVNARDRLLLRIAGEYDVMPVFS